MIRRAVLQWVLLGALGVLLLVVGVVAVFAPSRAAIAERACRFDEHVCRASERLLMDGALIAAVIAVESRGEVRARSTKGALGLMQLLPGTARETAARLGIPIESDEDIFVPEINILLGSAYLKRQLDGFEGDERLALAAYNAGPRRVREWLRAAPGLDSAKVLERNAYPATRAYVANVLAYRELIADKAAERN